MKISYIEIMFGAHILHRRTQNMSSWGATQNQKKISGKRGKNNIKFCVYFIEEGDESYITVLLF